MRISWTQALSLMAASCILTCFSTAALAAPVPSKKDKAAMAREVALVVTATIVKKTKAYDSKTRVNEQTIVVKVNGVVARNTAFKAVLRPGQSIRFAKSCTRRQKGVPPSIQNNTECGSQWATIPAAFLQKKGSKLTLKLRVLRSASRIVFATVSATIPETGVIKGTVLSK